MIKLHTEKVNIVHWESIDDHCGLKQFIQEVYKVQDVDDNIYLSTDSYTVEVEKRELEDKEIQEVEEIKYYQCIDTGYQVFILLTDLCNKDLINEGKYLLVF